MKLDKTLLSLLSIILLTLPSWLGNAQNFVAANDQLMTSGRCIGRSPCSACSNCSRCGWCNSGGSCGVCGGGYTGTDEDSDETSNGGGERVRTFRRITQLRAVPEEYVPGEYYPGNASARYTRIPNLDTLGGCPPNGLANEGQPQHDVFVEYSKYKPASEYKYIPLQSLLTDNLDGSGLVQGDSVFTYAYVSKVTLMPADSCNCKGKTELRKNTAIELIEEPGSTEHAVGIMTPRVKILRQANRLPHRQIALKKYQGRWVCVTGILAVDDNDTSNMQWKIHPIIDIEPWEDTVEVEIED